MGAGVQSEAGDSSKHVGLDLELLEQGPPA